jgi:TetR/AcrR family transcriptional regulator, transcriptional repressor of aconitase
MNVHSTACVFILENTMTRVTQQHIDARRESILDAAARLFARKGISAATMADIAAEADLSAGAIYRYFDGKEELVRAVFEDATERNQQLFHGELEAANTPLDALERVGRRVWIEVNDRDSLICDIQMALTAARDPDDLGIDVVKNRHVVRGLLKEIVQAAQEAGQIDPDVDAGTLALLLQATTNGIQMLKLETEEQSSEIEQAFDLMVRMVFSLQATGAQPQER